VIQRRILLPVCFNVHGLPAIVAAMLRSFKQPYQVSATSTREVKRRPAPVRVSETVEVGDAQVHFETPLEPPTAVTFKAFDKHRTEFWVRGLPGEAQLGGEFVREPLDLERPDIKEVMVVAVDMAAALRVERAWHEAVAAVGTRAQRLTAMGLLAFLRERLGAQGSGGVGSPSLWEADPVLSFSAEHGLEVELGILDAQGNVRCQHLALMHASERLRHVGAVLAYLEAWCSAVVRHRDTLVKQHARKGAPLYPAAYVCADVFDAAATPSAAGYTELFEERFNLAC